MPNLFEKAVDLQELSIDGIDIRPQLAELNISEDIFSPTISGEVQLNDSLDVRSILPITGNETIKVKFKKPKKDAIFDKEFKLYNVKDIAVDTGLHKNQDNTLRFSTQGMLDNLGEVVYRTYKAKKISEIVEDIFKRSKLFGNFKVEPTFGQHDIVIPGWHPFDAIQWLGVRAEKSPNRTTTFLFFENAEGYQFRSLEEMMDSYQREEYAFFVQNAAEDYEIPKEQVITYDFINYLDVIKSLYGGMWASKLLSFDITRLRTEQTTFNYDEDFKKAKHVDRNGNPFTGKNKALVTEYDAVRKFQPTTKTHDTYQPIKSKQPDIKPNRIENWLLPRISKAEQVRYYRVRLVVPGTLKLKAGDTITFEMPLVNVGSDKDNTNKYYKGKYLITSIKHKITNDGYIQIIEAIKDDVVKSYDN